ncbi:polyserase-2 isoform X14 [Manis javanica]|uniref:polyserase-2 isoform X14 n=1 Tax=Manis javanica TaxID=9974 RepID=UPI003C6D438B
MSQQLLLALVILALSPSQEEPEDLDCGRPEPSDRITGGSDAQPGTWPWQKRDIGARGQVVGTAGRALSGRAPERRAHPRSGCHPGAGQLQQSGTGRRLSPTAPGLTCQAERCCAARLPAPRLAPLRSWHCLLGHRLGGHPGGGSDRLPRDLDNWRVLLPSRPRTEQVARLVPHENASWDDASDLALLELRAPVNLSVAPRPVCLPYSEHYFLPGSRCRLARWGRGGEQECDVEWGGARADFTAARVPSHLLPDPAPGPNSLLEAELLDGWWCHCLYGRQGASVPPPGDPPQSLCTAYQEEEEAGRCWQNYSHWSLLCREEGTWFLAGIRDFSSDCLRPRAFHSLQTHSPWISHVARGAYLEDQLAWDWSPEGEETETQICPPTTEYGACGLRQDPAPSGVLWPWLAEVHVAGYQVCAGILVAPGWVLAATHCVLRPGSTTVPYTEVYLGRAGASPLPQAHQVSRLVISIHLPQHLGPWPPLALLELSSRVEPSPSALPICLHPGGIPLGTSCWVLCWKDPQDRVPVAAAVSILTPRLCHCLYQGILPPGTLCVLYAEGQEDRCEVQGSGHPASGREEAVLGIWTLRRSGLEFLGAGPQMGRSSTSLAGPRQDQGPGCLRWMETSSASCLKPRRCRGPGGRVRDPFGLGSDTAGDLSTSTLVPDSGRILGSHGHGCSRKPGAICRYCPRRGLDLPDSGGGPFPAAQWLSPVAP